MAPNLLIGVPLALVLFGLLSPIAFLGGAAAYLRFLWSNPTLVVVTLAAWWVIAYWCTRRVASIVFLRTSGAKLRIGNGTRA